MAGVILITQAFMILNNFTSGSVKGQIYIAENHKISLKSHLEITLLRHIIDSLIAILYPSRSNSVRYLPGR